MDDKPVASAQDYAADMDAASMDRKAAEPLDPSPETYAAIMATNKPNPLGPGYIKLYMLSACVFLCSTMNGKCPRCLCRRVCISCFVADLYIQGFDAALMGSINALPNFTTYFDLPPEGNASTGIVFSIFQVCIYNDFHV